MFSTKPERNQSANKQIAVLIFCGITDATHCDVQLAQRVTYFIGEPQEIEGFE